MSDYRPLRPIGEEEDIDDLWVQLHSSLSVDYTLPKELVRTPEGVELEPGIRVAADCHNIAQELAKGLVKKGLKPSGLFISPIGILEAQQNGDNKPKLHPKVFGVDIEWTCHIVCEVDGMVYDPIFAEPLPRQEYLERMFGETAFANPMTTL